jgi:hypothetical protein
MDSNVTENLVVKRPVCTPVSSIQIFHLATGSGSKMAAMLQQTIISGKEFVHYASSTDIFNEKTVSLQ